MDNKLPQGWVECELKDIFDTSSGGTPKRGNPAYYGGDIPWMKSGELNNGIVSEAEEFITEEGLKNSSAKLFPRGSLLIALYGATVGKLGILDFDSTTNQAICCIYQNNNYNRDFLFYYLLYKKEYLVNQGKGGAQPNISQEIIKALKIPVPSLNEQKRIVEKIEEEFGKIDAGVEKLKSAQEQIKQYRQSVLKSAFEGKLVANNKNYRDNNFTKQLLKKITEEKEFLIKNKVIQKAKDINEFNIEHIKDLIPTEWQWVKLNDIAFVTKLAGFEYTKYINLEDDGEVPVIRAQNVRTYNLDESSLKYIDMKTSLMLERSALTKKCILMTFIGAGIGDTALFDKEIRYHLAPNVAKIELFNNNEYKISEEYITYYLLSTVGKMEIFKSLKATAQPSLSMGTIRDIYVPLCTLDEQKQIVKEIEKRFEVTDEVERVIVENLEKAEQLKQSILKKAFEGRLVPQDPTDEPASELLAKIQAERKK